MKAMRLDPEVPSVPEVSIIRISLQRMRFTSGILGGGWKIVWDDVAHGDSHFNSLSSWQGIELELLLDSMQLVKASSFSISSRPPQAPNSVLAGENGSSHIPIHLLPRVIELRAHPKVSSPNQSDLSSSLNPSFGTNPPLRLTSQAFSDVAIATHTLPRSDASICMFGTIQRAAKAMERIP